MKTAPAPELRRDAISETAVHSSVFALLCLIKEAGAQEDGSAAAEAVFESPAHHPSVATS